MKEIWFHDFYTPASDEALTRIIASQKFGWASSNPGPIIAYPINWALFPKGIPGILPAKTSIAVPWTQARITKEIRLTHGLIKARKLTLNNSIRALRSNTKEVNRVATTVDVVAAVLMLNVGLGSAAAGAKKVMSGSAQALNISASTVGEAMAVVNKMKAAGQGLTYAGLQTIIGLDPGAFVGRGKSLVQVAARHAMSITSPSYWASLVASAWTGDWDLWKYGAQAVEDREVARRLRIFAKEVGGFALKIAALERQHGMSFYNYRVAQSSQVYMPPPFRGA